MCTVAVDGPSRLFSGISRRHYLALSGDIGIGMENDCHDQCLINGDVNRTNENEFIDCHSDFMANPKKRKLVLHFDVRNTVLVADSVTNDSVEQALNSYLTGVTWGRATDAGWKWSNNTPSIKPPHPGVMTYYKFMENQLVKEPQDRATLRRVTGDFTQESIGCMFSEYFYKHLKLLEWPHASSVTEDRLTMHGKDGKLYHYMLPAFFKLIHHLHEEKRDFSVIFRTYGLDAPNVLECLSLTMNGKHPSFPQPLPIKVNLSQGRITRHQNQIQFETINDEGFRKDIFTSEKAVYNMLGTVEGACAFKDDFRFWQTHDYHHTAGKPFWVDLQDTDVQHIIFDDNIRIDDIDSIVDVRLFDKTSTSARSLNREDCAMFEDVCLVHADLLQSTANIDYFIEKVATCEKNYDSLLSSLADNPELITTVN